MVRDDGERVGEYVWVAEWSVAFVMILARIFEGLRPLSSRGRIGSLRSPFEEHGRVWVFEHSRIQHVPLSAAGYEALNH